MRAVRTVGLIVIAVAAIFVYVFVEPEQPEESSSTISPTSYDTLIDAAMSDFEANDSRTESAPQQQVVNGWVARDLLRIQALEFADLLEAVTEENQQGQLVAATDPRIPALLGLAVLAICLIGITSTVRDSPTTEPLYAGRHSVSEEDDDVSQS